MAWSHSGVKGMGIRRQFVAWVLLTVVAIPSVTDAAQSSASSPAGASRDDALCFPVLGCIGSMDDSSVPAILHPFAAVGR